MPTPLCTECGACCVCTTGAPLYVELTPSEVAVGVFASGGVHHNAVLRGGHPMDPVWGLRTKTTPIGLCACTFLEGTVLGHTRCAIYSDRPEGCVRFIRGGPGCDAVLARVGKLLLA